MEWQNHVQEEQPDLLKGYTSSLIQTERIKIRVALLDLDLCIRSIGILHRFIYGMFYSWCLCNFWEKYQNLAFG